jgi:PAS domain S-box-containing protein
MSQTLSTLLETVQHRFDRLERTVQAKDQANRGNCGTIAEMKTEIQALRLLIEELQDQTQGLVSNRQSLEIDCQRDIEAYAEELRQINQQLQQEIHERNQVEATLRQSESRFRELTETIQDVFYISAPGATETLYVSPAYEKIWGRSCDALYQHANDWSDAIHPDEREQVWRDLNEHLHLGGFEAEYRIIRPDGTIRWILDRNFPVYDETGQLIRIVGVAKDVSDRVQMEQERQQVEMALRESEARYRTITELTSDYIYSCAITPDGHMLEEWATPNMARITGYTVEDFPTGENAWLTAVYPDDLERVCRFERDIIERNQPGSLEYRIITKSGETRWICDRIQPQWSEAEQRVVRFLGAIEDITQRKHSETQLRQFNAELEHRVHQRTQELQDSEERFRLAFDNAVNGIALISPDGYWLKVNPALCQILGYTEQEFYALTVDQITHPDDLEPHVEAFRRALAGEISISQIEKRYLHKLGHPVWTICAAVLVRDRDNVPLYFVTQVQDITERREIDQLKQEFISIVSHELRTPLTSIQGSLGLLTAGVLNDEPDTMNHMLTIAESEAQRLVRLVNDILDLERLEAYNVILNQQWWRVSTLIEQAIAALQSFFDQHCVTISICPDLLEIWADRDRIVQVLVNLLSNATKFSPVGSTISLSVEYVSTPIPHALFQIRDDGRGIPSHQLEAIFGRFKQVDSSDSRNQGGSGLGLAICRNIVQQHGGRIWVESTLGEGSTFYFTIPRPSE